MHNLKVLLRKAMNINSNQMRKFPLIGALLVLCLCVNVSVTFASTVWQYYNNGPCWASPTHCPNGEYLSDCAYYDSNGKQFCPYDIYYVDGIEHYNGCFVGQQNYCPSDWSYQKVDNLTATADVTLSTDNTKPTLISLDHLNEMTAVASSITISDYYDWYQYTVMYRYYDWTTNTWGNWTEYTNSTTNSSYYSWYLPNKNLTVNKHGNYAIYARVRANYVNGQDASTPDSPDVYYFTTFDSAYDSPTSTFTYDSQGQYKFTVQGSGAPFEDYLYRFGLLTISAIDNSVISDQPFNNVPTDSTVYWTPPPYRENVYYELYAEIGTSSKKQAYGGDFQVDNKTFIPYFTASPLTIFNDSLPYAQFGIPYNGYLFAQGGTTPYTWSLWNPMGDQYLSLPPGLSLDQSLEAIVGTPTATGNFQFRLMVKDSENPPASQIKIFSIYVYPPISINTNSPLPKGTFGNAYNQTLSASGGNGVLTWSLYSGNLPTGLYLNSLGVISGVPQSYGNHTFIASVHDSLPWPTTAKKDFSIYVYPPLPPLLINTNTPLSSGTAGNIYNQALSAGGGSGVYTWSLYNGSIPAGLNLSSSGVISGTPQNSGSYTFTVRLSDNQNSTPITKQFTINVYDRLRDTTLYTTLGAYPIVGSPYSFYLTATGGKTPYNWTIVSGNLPPGLSLNSSSGLISGTPTTTGSYTCNIRTSDSLNPPASISTTWIIPVYNPLQITTSTLPNGMAGTFFSQTLTASGGTMSYTSWIIAAGSLPEGLSLNSSTGVISGTPHNGGPYSFIVQVSDSQNPPNTATMGYSIVVTSPISIITNSLPPGSAGNFYSLPLISSGGTGLRTWSITSGSLPPDLIFSPNGIIYGTPQNGGSYTFTVQVSDQSPTPATATTTLTLNVAYPSLQITTGSLSSGTAGSIYTQSLAASGGNGVYSWSITSGSLPAGLSLDSTTGIISGMTADVGSFTLTVQASDGQGAPATASRTYLLNIENGIMQRCTDFPTVLGNETSTRICTASTTDIVTGVVDHDQELFSTKGAALSTTIELFYKSQPAYSGPLGPGWSHTYDIFLTVNSDGSVVLRDGSGSKSFYTKSGSSYISPPGDFSTLVKNADNSYTITYRDGLKKNFRSDGRIASIADRFNNTISFSYDGNDLTSITDSAQRITHISYDQSVTLHKISFITDPNGNTYDFAYEGNNLYRVTNPVADPAVSQERGYWEYQYYPDGYLKSKSDPNGNTGQYTYYADHRMWQAIDPEGQIRTIVYPTTTGNLRTSTLTEKDGGPWLYTYDAQNGVIKQKTDPNGKVIKYTYYQDGNLKSKTEPKDDAVSLTTFYTYDSYGNVLTQTNPLDISNFIDAEYVSDPEILATYFPEFSPAIRYSYDNNNFDRLTSISDERVTPFRTTSLVYTTENGGEVVTATTTPGNYVTVIKKNPNGTVKESIDANGKSTTFTYYPDTTANRTAGIVGLLQTVTDPAGIVTTITSYDLNGNPLGMTVKDTAGTVRLTTSQQHNALNYLKQLTKTTALLPDIVTQYGYDLDGNMNSLLDAEHHLTSYLYNYNRQVTQITDAKLNNTIFKYSGSEGNGVDQLVGVYDANVAKNTPLDSQPHTAFNYDKLGRLDTETDQVGKKIHYTYYDNGLVKEKYDATNSAPGTPLVTYTYNNQGQITDKTFTDGTFEHYTYKPDGKLETAANQNISYTYTYYDDGRLHSVTDSSGRQISYDQYDSLGQRKQVTILKGAGSDERVISYDYDDANRPWHIYNGNKTFTYAYDNLGRRDTLSYPNGTTAHWDFDDLNRLTAITHKVTNGATFTGFYYTDYDKVGNRKNVTGNKNEIYSYNELYQLLTVSSAKPESFEYDAVGNRHNGPSPDDIAFAKNDANQMTQGRKLGYGYDNFGNQTTRTIPGASDKSWVQTWDLQNRLTKMEKTKGSEKRIVTFTYDPLGRRIGKQMTIVKDGVTQTQSWIYVYDGDSIVVEIYTDESNAITKTFYTQGPGVDEHLGLERGGQFYYYHADGLGNIAAITDANKAVVQSYEYDSYGMVTASTDFRNNYTYTSREWDKETGLYYYRARYYDPMDGRFVSKDPIGFRGGDVNLYGYVQGNPVNMVDPWGLDSYVLNRQIGSDIPTDSFLSHTFIYTTNSDGTIKNTYSWGNTYKDGKGLWSINAAEDRFAAEMAHPFKSSRGTRIGDSSIDDVIDTLVKKWRDDPNHPSRHPWRLFNNCKTEANRLKNEALK